jgi:hypothetical protein
MGYQRGLEVEEVAVEDIEAVVAHLRLNVILVGTTKNQISCKLKAESKMMLYEIVDI